MKKNMYSLMLMDSLVKLLDNEAYLNGTNRSNMINQILAQHFNYSTPEMRIKEVFGLLCSSIPDNNFRILENPSDNIITVKSSLDYKYRPTIKYQVELYRQAGSSIGNLSVMFRTQSTELIKALADFFEAFTEIEAEFLNSEKISYSFDGLRFTRQIKNHDNCSAQELSEELERYIKMLDSLLKGYLMGDITNKGEISTAYKRYLLKRKIEI